MQKSLLALAALGAALPAVAFPIAVPEGSDAYWDQTDNQSGLKILLEDAGYAPNNTFGIYEKGNAANKVQIFAGSNGVGDSKILTIKNDGSVWVGDDKVATFADLCFGLYLTSP